MTGYKFLKASDGTGNAVLAHVTLQRLVGSTVLKVDSVSKWNVAGFIATVGTLGSDGFLTPGTVTEITGHITAGDIIIDGFEAGSTDIGNSVNQVVIIKQTTGWANRIAEYANPVGAIIEFGGSAAPTGWLLCDGSAVSRTTYADLFTAIGTAYGVGDGSTTFNVPDKRDRVSIGAGTGTFTEVVGFANVTTATDQLTVSAAGGRQLLLGTPVVLTTSGGLPAPLATATTYYVISVDATHIKLATSLANALAGTAIDITTQGTGNHTLTLTFTARAVGDRGGEEAHPQTSGEMATHNHGITDPGHSHQWLSGNGGAAGGGAFTAAINNAGFNTGAPTTSNGTGITINNNGSGTPANIMQPWVASNFIIRT